MKTLKFLLAAFLLQTAFYPAQNIKTLYYYVVGWEDQPQTARAKMRPEPVFSDVLKISCAGELSSLHLDSQMNDYYKKRYAKERGYLGLHRTDVKGPFSTAEQAEKERMNLIVEYDVKYKPLVLHYFEAGCTYKATADSAPQIHHEKKEGGGVDSNNTPGLLIEKKDTRFQEAEADRKRLEQKADAMPLKKNAAPKAQQRIPVQKKLIKKTGSSRQ